MCRRTARRQRRHIRPKYNHKPCGAFLLIHRTRSLSVVLLWPRCYMAQRLGLSVCLCLTHSQTHTVIDVHQLHLKMFSPPLPSPRRAEPSVGFTSWLQPFPSSSADLLMTPAGCGTSICCRARWFPFFSFLWWDAEAEKPECVSGRTTGKLNRRKMKTEETCVDEKRRDSEYLEVIWVLSSAACSSPLCMSVCFTHTLLHCCWTWSSTGEETSRRTRKTELASDYIPAETSQIVYRSL